MSTALTDIRNRLFWDTDATHDRKEDRSSIFEVEGGKIERLERPHANQSVLSSEPVPLKSERKRNRRRKPVLVGADNNTPSDDIFRSFSNIGDSFSSSVSTALTDIRNRLFWDTDTMHDRKEDRSSIYEVEEGKIETLETPFVSPANQSVLSSEPVPLKRERKRNRRRKPVLVGADNNTLPDDITYFSNIGDSFNSSMSMSSMQTYIPDFLAAPFVLNKRIDLSSRLPKEEGWVEVVRDP